MSNGTDGRAPAASAPDDSGWLTRPVAALDGLPVEYRWEFMRRHPYYVQYWRLAQLHYAPPAGADPRQRACARIAAMLLVGIGVTASPPPPTLAAADPGAPRLGRAWAGGAVSILTYRTMAGMMLAGLSAEAKLRIATALAASAGRDPGDVASQFDDVAALLAAPEAELDAAPPRPVIGVNVEAPQRAIAEAVASLVKGWKAERGIDETRRRPDVLAGYLAVWDAREGWTGGNYDADKERTFAAVARERGAPLQTVVKQYKAAFELVAGHPYTFVHWVRLFRETKLLGSLSSKVLARRRPLGGPRVRRGAPKLVTNTLLQGRGRRSDDDDGRREAGPRSGTESTEGAREYLDLIIDAADLIERGLSDAEIGRRLKFADAVAGAELLRKLRAHARGLTPAPRRR